MSKIKIPNATGGFTVTDFDSNGRLAMHEAEDPSAVLKQNAFERNHMSDTYLGKGTESSAKKIGSISPVMMLNLIEQGVFWDDKKLLKWFDDLDNYLWRTSSKTRQ